MKIKIIKAYIAVFTAVSVAYGGIRAAYLSAKGSAESTFVLAQAAEDSEILIEDSYWEKIDEIPKEEPQESAETSEDSESTSRHSRTKKGFSEQTDQYMRDYIKEDSSTDTIQEEEESYSEYEEYEEEESYIDYVEEESVEEEVFYEPVPEPDVPTLEDYLNQFRCGGCGNNCSLLNPRCRTGRRKAESTAEEYYTIYGG